jgi:hypothetical protein
VVSGLLNAMYYFPILWQMYFVSPGGQHEDNHGHGHDEAHHGHEEESGVQWDQIPLTMKIPIAVTALGIIVLGVAGIFMFDYLQQIVVYYLG